MEEREKVTQNIIIKYFKVSFHTKNYVVNVIFVNGTYQIYTSCYFFYRYERLLRRAKTEDLTEVSGIGCLYQSGVDRLGRPVVVFIGKWFPFNKINLDKVCCFLV